MKVFLYAAYLYIPIRLLVLYRDVEYEYARIWKNRHFIELLKISREHVSECRFHVFKYYFLVDEKKRQDLEAILRALACFDEKKVTESMNEKWLQHKDVSALGSQEMVLFRNTLLAKNTLQDKITALSLLGKKETLRQVIEKSVLFCLKLVFGTEFRQQYLAMKRILETGKKMWKTLQKMPFLIAIVKNHVIYMWTIVYEIIWLITCLCFVIFQ